MWEEDLQNRTTKFHISPDRLVPCHHKPPMDKSQWSLGKRKKLWEYFSLPKVCRHLTFTPICMSSLNTCVLNVFVVCTSIDVSPELRRSSNLFQPCTQNLLHMTWFKKVGVKQGCPILSTKSRCGCRVSIESSRSHTYSHLRPHWPFVDVISQPWCRRTWVFQHWDKYCTKSSRPTSVPDLISVTW